MVTLLMPFAAVSAQTQDIVYIVQPGDTLFSISQGFQVPLQTIAAVNGIYNINLIFAGQHLIIPLSAVHPLPPTHPPVVPPTVVPPTATPTVAEPLTYVVRPGDRLATIANTFQTTVAALAAANGLTNVNLIQPGQELLIVPPDFSPFGD
ncbi:MAG: LysM peptidoglycan-binding domain-containing protein [Chloroflexi bacterium]|nr:LysM peptidoglycan-binding domain-containing protein [Chloroflexota bacterium]